MIMETTELKQIDLQHIVRGACLLGSGGGGGYETGMKLVSYFAPAADTQLYYTNSGYTVQTITAADAIGSGRIGIVVAYLGSPEKAARLTYPRAAEAAVRKAAELTGVPVNQLFIIPAEIGAISSATACLVAARLDVPVLNGDPAGRAVPTLSLLAFSAHGLSVNPTVLSSEPAGDEDSIHTVLEVENDTDVSAASKIETLARPVVSQPEYDHLAGLALWVMKDTSNLENMIVPGTLSLCQSVGTFFAGKQRVEEHFKPKSILPFFQEYWKRMDMYYPCHFYTGTLQSAYTKTLGGFDMGVIDVQVDNQLVKMLFQNETLLVWDSAKEVPPIMAPDLIAYIIEDDYIPEKGRQLLFTNEDIMENGVLKEELEGKTIHIFGFTSPSLLLRSEQAVANERASLLSSLSMRNENEAGEGVLPKNFMAVVNSLGYYGCPILMIQ